MQASGTFVVPGCKKLSGGTFRVLGLGPMVFKRGKPVGQPSYFIKQAQHCPTGDEMDEIRKEHPTAYVVYSGYDYE
jgi:hypothetical protein